MMNKEFKARWVKALRSRKYKQGKDHLHKVEDGEHYYCCLGVLCEIVREEAGIRRRKIKSHYKYGTNPSNKKELLPIEVSEYVGLTGFQNANPEVKHPELGTSYLADFNDRNVGFRTLARLIDEQL